MSQEVREGRIIPFVGAGFSFVAGFPGWLELLEQASRDLVPDTEFGDLCRSCGGDPLRIAEYLLVRSGGRIGPVRHQLSLQLRTPERFTSSAHIDLVNLRMPVIYTTNFDELIEVTHTKLGVDCEIVATARDLAVSRGNRRRVVKFHGDLRYEDTLVLTESSFFARLGFESPLDLLFRGDLLGKSVLFIGYGMNDINVRAMWFKLNQLMRDVPPLDRPASYIVRVSPNPFVEALDRAVGLTTITLDPRGEASGSTERQRLLEQFMLDLSFAADEGRTSDGLKVSFASGALLHRAIGIVQAEPEHLSNDDKKVMETVDARVLHPSVKSDVEALMKTYSEHVPSGELAEYRRALALNYSMSYGSEFDTVGSRS